MRKILKDFYYGNLTPGVQEMTAHSGLRREVNTVSRCEQQLTGRLSETEQALLTELVKAQHEISSATALENFIMGFRLRFFSFVALIISQIPQKCLLFH